MLNFLHILPNYAVVFLIVIGTIFILSRLKPINNNSFYVDMGELSKCQSKAEKIMFMQFVKINLYAMAQVKVKGRLTADFYIPKWNLFVEVDGKIWHDKPEQKERDERKDRIIREELGANIVRIDADLLYKNPEEALNYVLRASYLNDISESEPVGQGV